MQIHTIRSAIKRKRGKRIGRGGKRGSYSGRGVEGQKSRAGRRLQPAIRGTIKKYPKLRGYRFKNVREKPQVVNVGKLEKHFEKGEVVSPLSLLGKRLVSRIKSKLPRVKILSRGELKKELVVEGCEVSKAAEEKIKKAKGKVK